MVGTLATPRKAEAWWIIQEPAKGASYALNSHPALVSVITKGRPAAAALAATSYRASSKEVRVMLPVPPEEEEASVG